jgi:type IV secretion system protein VirB8
MTPNENDYFEQAKSWADDIYIETIASRQRYRIALLSSVLVIFLLSVGLMILLPLEHTQLVMVHHSQDGTVWIEPMNQSQLKIDRPQIESDIVRYIVNRESYSPDAYDYHYTLTHLLSNQVTAKEYQKSQSADNPDSSINHFKNRMIRKVHVDNIIFIKNDPKHPLAQVNFKVIDHNRVTGRTNQHSMLALISWQYQGTPKKPKDRWQNWDGFLVTHYSVEQTHL